MDSLVSPKFEPDELVPHREGDISIVCIKEFAEDDIEKHVRPSALLPDLTEGGEVDIICYCLAMRAASVFADYMLDQCRLAVLHVCTVMEHQRAIKAGTVNKNQTRHNARLHMAQMYKTRQPPNQPQVNHHN